MLDLLVEGVGANFLTPFLLSTCTATMPPALPLQRWKQSPLFVNVGCSVVSFS